MDVGQPGRPASIESSAEVARGGRETVTLVRWGLACNILGTVFVGFSSFFGLAAGWGGSIVWNSRLGRLMYWLGWGLMFFGFIVQFIAS